MTQQPATVLYDNCIADVSKRS